MAEKLYGVVSLSREDMEKIYSDSEYKVDYFKHVSEIIENQLSMKMVVHKKFNGKKVLTVSLKCKICKQSASMSVKKAKISMDVVDWDIEANCHHIHGMFLIFNTNCLFQNNINRSFSDQSSY